MAAGILRRPSRILEVCRIGDLRTVYTSVAETTEHIESFDRDARDSRLLSFKSITNCSYELDVPSSQAPSMRQQPSRSLQTLCPRLEPRQVSLEPANSGDRDDETGYSRNTAQQPETRICACKHQLDLLRSAAGDKIQVAEAQRRHSQRKRFHGVLLFVSQVSSTNSRDVGHRLGNRPADPGPHLQNAETDVAQNWNPSRRRAKPSIELDNHHLRSWRPTQTRCNNVDHILERSQAFQMFWTNRA